MIRSGRIPPVLNRICDDNILAAFLVTMDGELLGASTHHLKKSSSHRPTMNSPLWERDPEEFGTLMADMAMDYYRLGEEMAALSVDNAVPSRHHQHHKSNSNSNSSLLLLVEMDGAWVGVMAAAGGLEGGWVMAVAPPTAPAGYLKARLQALAVHVQESLSMLIEAS